MICSVHCPQREMGTVIFTNSLLQLWGVIPGLLQGLCSVRHKNLKLFPIYGSSLFPPISGLTFFNLQHLDQSEIPIPTCPVGLSSLSHSCYGHQALPGTALAAASLPSCSPTQGDLHSSELTQEFGLSSGQKGP